MSRRFQFSLKWLFVAMLAVACFFGGIHFERERQRRQDEADVLAAKMDEPPLLSFPTPADWERMERQRK